MTTEEHAPTDPKPLSTDEHTAPAVGTPSPKKSRFRKWLKRGIISFLVLLLLLSLFTVWLVRTPAGLRFATFTAPSWFGVNLSAKTLNGTIWKGFDATELTINMDSADVTVSNMALVWRSSELWSRRLWVDTLAVGLVHVQTKDTETKTKDKTPLTMPKDIGLPLNVHIGSIKLQGLTLNRQKEKIVWDSAISYEYQNDQHKLSIPSLNTPWMQLNGQTTLVNQSPFALNGALNLSADMENVLAKGAITLTGNLQEPVLSGELNGKDLAITVAATPRPFEKRTFKKINQLRITAGGLNLNDFDNRAPTTRLSMGLLFEVADEERLGGHFDFANLEPLPLSQKGIPLRLIQSQLFLDRQGMLAIDHFFLYGLEDGEMDLTGTVDLVKQHLNLNLNLADVQAKDITESTLPDKLNGDVKALGNWTKPDISWLLATEKLDSTGKLNFLRQKKGQQLSITEASIKAKAGGGFQLTGTLDLFEKQALKLKASTNALNPSTILPDLPGGSITSELTIDGFVAAPLTLNGKLTIAPSRLADAALKGLADITLAKDHLSKANINIVLGSNTFQTQGSFGAAADKLAVNINAPNLKEAGLDLSGSLHLNGSVAGEMKKLKIDLNGKANALQYKNIVRLNQLEVTAKLSPDIHAPANVKIDGKDLFILGKTEQEHTRIQYINLNLNGTGAKHQLSLASQSNLGGNDYKIQVASNGGLNQNNDWTGTIQKLDIQGALDILLQTPVSLQAGLDHMVLGRANWAALGGTLQLETLSWKQGKGFVTKGSANNLQVGKLSKIVAVPYTENLTLKGDWDIQYGSSMHGYAKIEHQAGDILIPASKSGRKTLPAGIKKLLLDARLQGNLIKLNINGLTQHATLTGDISLNQNASNFSLSGLGGHLRLSVPDLTTMRILIPVGMNVAGSLQADVRIAGTVGKPSLGGTLNGDNLLYRERNLGFRLAEGTLRSHFTGQGIAVDSLVFRSYNGKNRPSGTLTATGQILLENNKPKVDINVNFAQFNIFEARPNRILVISGNSSLKAIQDQGIFVNGDLKVDFARIDLPKVGTPALDDDVVILTDKPVEKTPLPPVTANINIDLGERFMFQGIGLNVTLGGKLAMSSQPGTPIKALGRINVLKGAYRAYGQDLITEKGTIVFVGNLTNPILDIRAKRRYSPVGAGVEVKGPVSAMMVTLIADEAMSQKDKLSWLVLGRAPGSEQDEEALAASAGAWLAGSVNDKVQFFDDLGISTKPKKILRTGEVSPAEQIAIVGKHLSETLYVGYEYGLDSAESAVRVTYQLTRTLQFILRAGTKASSGEAKYSVRFD